MMIPALSLLLLVFLGLFTYAHTSTLDSVVSDILDQETATKLYPTVDCKALMQTFKDIKVPDNLQSWKKLSLTIKLLDSMRSCKLSLDKGFTAETFSSLVKKLVISKDDNKDENKDDNKKSLKNSQVDALIKSLLEDESVTLTENSFVDIYKELMLSIKDDKVTHGIFASTLRFVEVGKLGSEAALIIPKLLKFANKDECILEDNLMDQLDKCIITSSVKELKAVRSRNPCIDTELLSIFTGYKIAAFKLKNNDYPQEAGEKAKEWIKTVKESTQPFEYDICNPLVWEHLQCTPPNKWEYIETFDRIFSSSCEAAWDPTSRCMKLILHSNGIRAWPKQILTKAIDILAEYEKVDLFSIPQNFLQLVLDKMPVERILNYQPPFESLQKKLSFITAVLPWKGLLALDFQTRSVFFPAINPFRRNIMQHLFNDRDKMMWIIRVRQLLYKKAFKTTHDMSYFKVGRFVTIVKELFGSDSENTKTLLHFTDWNPLNCRFTKEQIGDNYTYLSEICNTKRPSSLALKNLFEEVRKKLVGSSPVACTLRLSSLHRSFDLGAFGNYWFIPQFFSFGAHSGDPKSASSCRCAQQCIESRIQCHSCVSELSLVLNEQVHKVIRIILLGDVIEAKELSLLTVSDIIINRDKITPVNASLCLIKLPYNYSSLSVIKIERSIIYQAEEIMKNDEKYKQLLTENFEMRVENLSQKEGSHHCIALLMEIFANPASRLMKRSNTSVNEYIPEWFVSKKAGFFMGVIYARLLFKGWMTPTGLAPEFINLLIDSENIEKIQQFYDQHYPLKVVEKLVTNKIHHLSANPTTLGSISNLMYKEEFNELSNPEEEKEHSVQKLRERGMVEFYSFVAHFKEGLSSSLNFHKASLIHPISKIYGLFKTHLTEPLPTFKSNEQPEINTNNAKQDPTINS